MSPVFPGHKVGVIGFGRSGQALTDVLLARGLEVMVCDQRDNLELPEYLQEAKDRGQLFWNIPCDFQRLESFADWLAVSPGVSMKSSPWNEISVPILGEVEVAYRLTELPIIAITGTNGKSTTTSLIGQALAERALVGGNIGNPLVSLVTQNHPEAEYVVAEVSSFQLETIVDFHPRIAIVTNITSDHLDRHPTVADYVAAKKRVLEHLFEGDAVILSADNSYTHQLADELQSLPKAPRVLTFSVEKQVDNGAFFADDKVHFVQDGLLLDSVTSDLALFDTTSGRLNAMAAMLACRLTGLTNEAIVAGWSNFKPLHYRMEPVGQYGGLRFINDGKATNIGAVLESVRSYRDQPLVLIAGGKDKGGDFGEIIQELSPKSFVFLMGEAAPRFEQSCIGLGWTRYQVTQEPDRHKVFEKILEQLSLLGFSEGVVLFAPGCSSFDQYDSAEQRAEIFSVEVSRWIEQQKEAL